MNVQEDEQLVYSHYKPSIMKFLQVLKSHSDFTVAAAIAPANLLVEKSTTIVFYHKLLLVKRIVKINGQRGVRGKPWIRK